jgi:hypothetical protein
MKTEKYMTKVHILIDWETKHVIGVYEKPEEAASDYDKFCESRHLQIVIRDLIT